MKIDLRKFCKRLILVLLTSVMTFTACLGDSTSATNSSSLQSSTSSSSSSSSISDNNTGDNDNTGGNTNAPTIKGEWTNGGIIQ